MKRPLLVGAGCSILGAFPFAALVALVHGFPIPFRGMLSGPEAVIPSQVAVLVYGAIGGFVVLGLAGAAAGVLASRTGGGDPKLVTCLSVTLSLLFSAVLVTLLAALDLIIGPW